jgi:hypothetical protein
LPAKIPLKGSVLPANLQPFFAAPLAEAESRSINSASVDISPLYHNIETLPVQTFHDMSLVFPVFPDGD